MSSKWRHLIWAVPVAFVALVLVLAWHQDSDFWRTPPALMKSARDAARRVVDAARGKPVYYFAARFDHWANQPGDGWAQRAAANPGSSSRKRVIGMNCNAGRGAFCLQPGV